MKPTRKERWQRGPLAWMVYNRVTPNLLMLALLLGGFFVSGQIKKEVFPEFELDRVTVSVAYPGASPEEVEQGIVLVVEEAVRGLEGIKELTSRAGEGSGSVSIELLADINNIWIDKSGDKEGLSFGNATKALRKVSTILSEFMPSQAGGTTDEDAPMQEAAGSVPVASVAISRRSDVVHILDKICEYYSVHEPSSPVPLLLRRAQRLVEKSFLEILEDMVPDGLKQAKIVSGSTEKDA